MEQKKRRMLTVGKAIDLVDAMVVTGSDREFEAVNAAREKWLRSEAVKLRKVLDRLPRKEWAKVADYLDGQDGGFYATEIRGALEVENLIEELPNIPMDKSRESGDAK